jgi:hypothetical protein
LLFVSLLMVTAMLTSFGLLEASLGASVRLVYLHGAWLWTALVGLAAAAAAGLVGLLLCRPAFQNGPVAPGQAVAFSWVTYLPLHLWTMRASWNGLTLGEPRWRVSLSSAVIAVLLQLAILAFNRLEWASAVNTAFFIILAWTLSPTEQVMHPPSPIAASGSVAMRGFFLGLLALCLLAGWLLSRMMVTRPLRRPAD